MTTVDDVYKVALEQIVADGKAGEHAVVQAKMALAMGRQLDLPPSRENQMVGALRELQAAEESLHRAIKANSTSWTSTTDHRVTDALKYITNAIIKLK